MFNLYYLRKKDIKKHYSNWPQISDHLYRIFVVGGSGSGKTDALLILISH